MDGFISGIRHILPAYGKWHTLLDCGEKWLYAVDNDCDNIAENGRELTSGEIKDMKYMLEQYEQNRLSYFLPHGPKTGGGCDFLNDYKNEICLLTAPTRCGKSSAGIAFCLLRTIQCDPSWHTFKNHGIVCPPYRGKRRLVVSSYEWTNVQELWEEYLKWLPRSIANRYLADWGKYDSEHGRPRVIDLKTGKTTKAVLGDGTEVLFRCDKQAQGPWEGQRWDEGHFDEQRQRDKFIGYLRGTSNTQGLVQCCFTLTGHVVDDRPDTGASGWIKRELWDGTYTFGRNIGKYKLDIEHTPSVIMSADEKARLKKQWVTDPEANKDEETLRKAQARYWGGWESGSGLVIDNFYPEHHLVPEIVNMEHQVFRDATKYRGMDHGLGRPATCAWVMMFPWGDLLMYREYYEPGKVIPYHAKKIVEMSGNKRQESAVFEDEMVGESFKTYEEVFIEEEYFASVMDSRSFSSPAQESTRTMGQLYNDWGLFCTKAKGYRNEKIVPVMQSLFTIEADRPHLMTQLWKRGAVDDAVYQKWLKGRNGESKRGARIYLLCSLRNVISEINAWSKDPKTGLPKSENDHIIGGALKYVIAEDPKYWGNLWRDDHLKEDQNSDRVEQSSKFCAY